MSLLKSLFSPPDVRPPRESEAAKEARARRLREEKATDALRQDRLNTARLSEGGRRQLLGGYGLGHQVGSGRNVNTQP